ncbi:MAG TPA: hypothetical protein VFV33_26640, partial [Gemmatimonadaceae bacterium]|nr:hypothetical protein [Gemmatimonadaceae bacterium]
MIRRVPIAAAIAVLGIAAATRSDIAASRAEASVAPASPRVRARVPTPARPVSSTATPPAQPDGAEGARLFVWYNCGDCHGAGGSGAMAPSLQDNRWHYG